MRSVKPAAPLYVQAHWTSGRSAYSSTTYYNARAEVIAINRESVRVRILHRPYAFQGSRIDGKWWGSTVYDTAFDTNDEVRVPLVSDSGYTEQNYAECSERTFLAILAYRKTLAA